MKKIILPLSCLALLAACGDEITEVTKTIGIATVEKDSEMPECTSENKGEMIYVVDSAATFFCQDKKWQSLKGDAGDDGTSCTAKEVEDGIEVSCGDKVIGTIKNGEKGEKGDAGAKGDTGDKGAKGDNGDKGDKGADGAAGTSCTATKLEGDAGIEVKCGETVIDTLRNGANGADGKSAYEIARELDPNIGNEADWIASLQGKDGIGCTAESITDGVRITCPGLEDPEEITNGADGVNCTVADNAENSAYVTITCGTSKADIAKAYCGKFAYDPAVDACDAECGNVRYVSAKQFCDSRDSKVYKYVTIKGTGYSKTWMAENLNYRYMRSTPAGELHHDSSSFCYGDTTNSIDRGRANCDKYGRLYLWSAAMDSAGAISGNTANNCGYKANCSVSGNVRGVCPVGWHLPSKAEWDALLAAVGGKDGAGKLLKATDGWAETDEGEVGNGVDAYGFSALPAGNWYRSFNSQGIQRAARFANLGSFTAFWTSTPYVWEEAGDEYNTMYAHMNSMSSVNNSVSPTYMEKYYGYSVRCIKN